MVFSLGFTAGRNLIQIKANGKARPATPSGVAAANWCK